ncbi:MAG: Type II secretion system protein E (GspE) [Candidatus Gottesmanbacteria bacterium GW2011_GWA1_43_11]|uniref:Type II secretion system protein E (GspE) n=1 Tax=Candidatus Gottesmanbacteria bacterium GW2011_GWA1_43_11 TaxID=1618436 RepID=A0A0G1CIJ9_9BACT|nr:MAG: Type II secretion system protein E (GspE) [Candidatus Gottesmanbacteria bacterium GW2011_GWA1_43_11]
MVPAHKILDALVKLTYVTQPDADRYRAELLQSGQSIENYLLKKKIVSETQLAEARAQALGVPFITLVGKGVSPEVINYVPEPVARRYTLFPFDFDAGTNTLLVAMEDPFDLQVIEFLEQKTGKRIRPYLAIPGDILTAIDERYAQSLGAEVTAALKETVAPEIRTVEAGRLGEIIKEAPIAKIVSTLLEFAVKNRVSDIHIEPQEGKTRVRYRIDGILHEKLALPKSVHEAVISRIKILSDMKIDEKRIPQDGRFNFRMGIEEVDLRVSTLPTVNGEKIVMRLLKKTGGIPTLSELGLRGMSLKRLEEGVSRPHGIILVTGPTGSGKTTTLYSVLSRLNTTKVNIITLEDPVEYQIPGINQVQVNPAAGLTFAGGMRSFLRQDPNIMLVGEVRDAETTSLAIQAALTGHLVFSTLHTNNASGALPRLLDLGAEPFLVTSALNCVIGQRIVRRICAACKEEFEPPQEVIDDMRQVLGKMMAAGAVTLFHGKGCVICNKTGYQGRVGIFEVLPISEKIGKMILERVSSGDIERQAISEGFITMKEDGYVKVLEGVTTIEEVLRVAQD